jgi:hypothetical protein
MWEFQSHQLEEVNRASVSVVRVFISDGTKEECFFLEYKTAPTEEVVLRDAQAQIDTKNANEAEQAKIEEE